MFITSLLFGISASLDALLVGVSYGIRRVRIRSWQNLVISLVTLLGTCLSVGAGHQLTPLLPRAVANYGGSLVLACLGLYYLLKWCTASLKKKRRRMPLPLESSDPDPESGSGLAVSPNCPRHSFGTAGIDPGTAASYDCSAPAPDPAAHANLTLPEVFLLSLTLSLNNLGLGLSASLGGLPLIPAAVSTFFCSVFFLAAGNRLGGSPILQLAGQFSDPVSGLLLIALSLLQLSL